MDVTVTITTEEFLEFMAWKKDRDYYEKELDKETGKRELMAKKTSWAKEWERAVWNALEGVDLHKEEA